MKTVQILVKIEAQPVRESREGNKPEENERNVEESYSASGSDVETESL